MTQTCFTVTDNRKIAEDVYKMVLSGDCSGITAAGQFVNIQLDGLFLRRPISVCDYTENALTIIYKAVGSGTRQLALMQSGSILDILLPLGNGYDLSCSGERPLVIGGGVGVPPMYCLTKKLILQGARPICVLGFNTSRDVFYQNEFTALGAETYVTTADGSVGQHGFVTDKIKLLDGYSYYYACGPEPMLRAVYDTAASDGELSFEQRMGCGFGACMGCSCRTKYGNKRICKDGPVLKKEEIIW